MVLMSHPPPLEVSMATLSNRYKYNDNIFMVAATVDGAQALGDKALGVVIPENAVILRVIEDLVDVVGTDDNSGTIQLKLGSGGTAITAANAMPTAGVTETVLSATNLGTKLSTAKELVAVVATKAMASGKVRYYVEFMFGVK